MPLFWGPEPCSPPGCPSCRPLVKFPDFPRTHQTLGCLAWVSPRVPPEGEPKSKSDQGTKRELPPRTKPPPHHAEPGAGPGAAYLQRGGVFRVGAPMASRASGVRAGTREWVSASRSPPRCSFPPVFGFLRRQPR